jgi:hypothetical protein
VVIVSVSDMLRFWGSFWLTCMLRCQGQKSLTKIVVLIVSKRCDTLNLYILVDVKNFVNQGYKHLLKMLWEVKLKNLVENHDENHYCVLLVY